MRVYHGEPTRVLMGRFPKDEDLLQSLERYVQTAKIEWGTLAVIGALQQAQVGYYNQALKQYEVRVLAPDLEITGCIGNISLKEGQPLIHAHITLADADGRAFGGHLVPGNIIFAAEFWITEYSGEGPVRTLNRETDLYLWS